MPRLNSKAKELKEREERASEWLALRRDFLYTQRWLADMLCLSRRTVQQVEACRVSPRMTTLRRFRNLKLKHERERKDAA